jgi:hypothetical protein
MTKNILNAAVTVLAASSLLAGCDFEQPEAGCFVQDHISWAVKYDPVDDPKDQNNAACTVRAPTAELLGVFKFVDPDDSSVSLLTLRPAGLASRALRDTTNPSSAQTASGNFATERDAEDFCAAPTFSVATVDAAFVPAVPPDPEDPEDEGTPAIPATEVTYEFSNVRVYSAPSSPGTQLAGSLKYTRDGCTSTYEIRALWPAVGCDPDSDLPEENCGEGSGLNPDFAATCDAVAHICVPAKGIPSLVDSAE